jgi:hypothetical protein
MQALVRVQAYMLADIVVPDGSRARRASAQPGRPPVEPADADDHRDRPKGGDAGAGARAGPNACEDCGGDPRC